MLKSVKIDTTKLDTSFRRNKANIAANHMLKIAQSDQFRDMIINMDRERWLKGESRNSKFINLSNQQIYNLIQSGKEEWNDEVDYEIDLKIDDYHSKWSSVIGYMIPNNPTIFVNTKFFDTMSIKDVCSNCFHEWLHTMGARHSGNYFRDSLAYYMNYIVEKLYDHIIDGTEEIKTETYCVRSWKTLWFKRCYTGVVRWVKENK